MTMQARKTKHLWVAWHRTIGMLACIGMVMWGLSGASHPLMTRLQPVPQQFVPPLQAVDLRHALPLPELLQQQGLTSFQHISVAQLDGQAYYRVQIQSGKDASYFAMHTGKLRPAAEAAHAKALARYYTGLPHTRIRALTKITQFTDDYPAVNRILPVWRVDFEEAHGLRAYVDTEQSRLATLVDQRKAWLTKGFQWGHTWSFLAGLGGWQFVVANLMLGWVFASAVSGLVLFFLLKRTAHLRWPQGALGWWHRKVAMVVVSALLLLASSGLWHLWRSEAQSQRPNLAPTMHASASQIHLSDWQRLIAELNTAKVLSLDVYGGQQHLFWQVIAATAEHAANTTTKALPLAQGAMMHPASKHSIASTQLASSHAHHPPAPMEGPMPTLWVSTYGHLQRVDTSTFGAYWLSQWSLTPVKAQLAQWVTHFGGEYGFIFKRLPVIQLTSQDANHTRFYVEPATGALAAVINDDDALEGWVFATLHKWNLPGLSKNVRDTLAICVALSVALTGLMGLLLLIRKRSPR